MVLGRQRAEPAAQAGGLTTDVPNKVQIRDPIHGSIDVTTGELALIDSPFFQRLRHVKQLGFGEFAFPGATHTRYAHSIGAMHLSSLVLDALLRDFDGPAEDRRRMRQAVRLAILFHDVGHPPLSHASETTMPSIGELDLPDWVLGSSDNADSQAAHEHYTLAILLKTEVADRISHTFGSLGLTPEAIAGLVAGRPAPGPNPFESGGVDYQPMLGQIVSGELDADRMDYLLRDSFYTGANYGRYDLSWIVENLRTVAVDGHAHMAVDKRAIFAFEDFLLSRYHMFLSVYFHYTPICFDHMLRWYYKDAPDEYRLPSDPEKYLVHDDIHLWTALRASSNRWARFIVGRQAWKLVAEVTENDKEDYDLDRIERELDDAGIDYFKAARRGVLSKYFGKQREPQSRAPLYVLDTSLDRRTPVESYTELYERYAKPMELSRIYCEPDRLDDARAIVAAIIKGAA